MMETREYKVYKFNELTDDQKEKAVYDLADINIDHDWWDCTYEDAENVGILVTSFDEVDVTGDVVDTEYTANKITRDHGNTCETYLTALQYIADFDEDYAYFLEKNGKFIGIITLEKLKEQQKLGGNIHDAIYCNEAINENLAISEFIGTIAEYTLPIAVVDDNGKYKGTISKSRLLKVFDEGVSNE